LSCGRIDELRVILAEPRRQLGGRRRSIVERQREPDERNRSRLSDDDEGRNLCVGYDLVDYLDRPVRDPRSIEQLRPCRQGLFRKEIREDRDQDSAVDDPIAV
jgi:hypothetical protein